ncbi:hypothetical protein ACLOJK_029943 [Asimina triloba]
MLSETRGGGKCEKSSAAAAASSSEAMAMAMATIPSQPSMRSRDASSVQSLLLLHLADLQLHDSIKKGRDTERKEEKKKRQLGDYLDSKLLSAISSKMRGERWDWEGEKKQRRVAEFEWPTEELRALSEDGRRDKTDGAVNCGNDLETGVKEEGAGGKGSCSPFRRFEETVLTLSHRQ